MQYKGRRLFSTNPIERKVLCIVFASALIPVLVVVAFFYAFFYDVIYGYLKSGLADHFIRRFLGTAVYILALYFIGVGSVAYHFVHRVFGAFPRILKELDCILTGEHRRPIKLRSGDYGQEIVTRINALIQRLPPRP